MEGVFAHGVERDKSAKLGRGFLCHQFCDGLKLPFNLPLTFSSFRSFCPFKHRQ
jgi:hypothetical protein